MDRRYFSTERLKHGRFSARFYERLGLKDGEPIPESLRAHIAAGVQRAVEDAAIRMAGKGRNLCLAGRPRIERAAGIGARDAVGLRERVRAAGVGQRGDGDRRGPRHLARRLPAERARCGWRPSASARRSRAAEIKQVLENCKLRFHYLVTSDEVIQTAVEQLNDNKIVAWMHGRMEFGARALGNRSILASPLDPYSTENLNIFIKHREPFRKFAASVPAELCAEYFEVGPNARYLSTVGRVRPEHRERFAAAILAGDLVRVHAVDRDENPLYWKLLHAAGKATGLPVLYNTSFNLFGEPLVCTPRDAVRSFYSSGIDAMFVGNFFLQK